MGPHIFFRVEDDESRARYYGRAGLFAEDTDTWVDFNSWDEDLLSEVEAHLDWGNRVPTPFISMYCNEKVAFREAERRVRAGKKKVRVYEINTRKRDEDMEWRNLRHLADNLGFDIPDCALNNSKYEYIFLRHVPDSTVESWTDFY